MRVKLGFVEVIGMSKKENICSECAHEKWWIDGDCCTFWYLGMCNGKDNRKHFKKKMNEKGVKEHDGE